MRRWRPSVELHIIRASKWNQTTSSFHRIDLGCCCLDWTKIDNITECKQLTPHNTDNWIHVRFPFAVMSLVSNPFLWTTTPSGTEQVSYQTNVNSMTLGSAVTIFTSTMLCCAKMLPTLSSCYMISANDWLRKNMFYVTYLGCFHDRNTKRNDGTMALNCNKYLM